MATLHAKNAIVYMQGSGTEAQTLTEAAEVSIDIDYDTETDSAFGDTWETRLKGLIRYNGSVNGNFDTAQALLFDAITQATSRKMYVYPDRATTTRYYYGTVWPRLSVGLPIGRATFSVSFEGDGALSAN